MPTMFIMRGLPGSGKSTLAKEVAAQHNAPVYSADDWFMRNGVYVFNRDQLGIAHTRCQYYVRQACLAGRNVVVDNTNVTWSEVKVYVEIARDFGYSVEVVIPSWTTELRIGGQWNFNFLRGRSLHGVPDEVLGEMVCKFQWDIESFIKAVLAGKPVPEETTSAAK